MFNSTFLLSMSTFCSWVYHFNYVKHIVKHIRLYCISSSGITREAGSIVCICTLFQRSLRLKHCVWTQLSWSVSLFSWVSGFLLLALPPLSSTGRWPLRSRRRMRSRSFRHVGWEEFPALISINRARLVLLGIRSRNTTHGLIQSNAKRVLTLRKINVWLKIAQYA